MQEETQNINTHDVPQQEAPVQNEAQGPAEQDLNLASSDLQEVTPVDYDAIDLDQPGPYVDLDQPDSHRPHEMEEYPYTPPQSPSDQVNLPEDELSREGGDPLPLDPQTSYGQDMLHQPPEEFEYLPEGDQVWWDNQYELNTYRRMSSQDLEEQSSDPSPSPFHWVDAPDPLDPLTKGQDPAYIEDSLTDQTGSWSNDDWGLDFEDWVPSWESEPEGGYGSIPADGEERTFPEEYEEPLNPQPLPSEGTADGEGSWIEDESSYDDGSDSHRVVEPNYWSEDYHDDGYEEADWNIDGVSNEISKYGRDLDGDGIADEYDWKGFARDQIEKVPGATKDYVTDLVEHYPEHAHQAWEDIKNFHLGDVVDVSEDVDASEIGDFFFDVF